MKEAVASVGPLCKPEREQVDEMPLDQDHTDEYRALWECDGTLAMRLTTDEAIADEDMVVAGGMTN